MLLKLSLLLSTIGIIACNVPFDTAKEVRYEETNEIHRRNCLNENNSLPSNIEVVYKYQTNEVNSVDDLVSGNIYQLNMPSIGSIVITNIISDYIVGTRFGETINITFDLPNLTTDNYLKLNYYAPSRYGNILTFKDGSQVQGYNIDNHITYFVYRGLDDYTDVNIATFISATDYNEIESVIYHQPHTIVGVINEFCETYLFSEIPYVNELSFNIGGQNINLLTWLIIAVGFAVSIGILILLFYVFRWLVLLFIGLIKK